MVEHKLQLQSDDWRPSRQQAIYGSRESNLNNQERSAIPLLAVDASGTAAEHTAHNSRISLTFCIRRRLAGNR